MVAVDTEPLSRYLRVSPLKLRDKGVRSVRSRVCNLCDLVPGLSVEILATALREAFEEVHGRHVDGHLEGEQPRRLGLASEDAGEGRVGNVETRTTRACVTCPAHKDDVSIRLDLREDHRMVGIDDEDELGTLGEVLLGVDHEIELCLVGRIRRLAIIRAVLLRTIGERITSKGDLANTGTNGGIRTVLQRDGMIGDGSVGATAKHGPRATLPRKEKRDEPAYNRRQEHSRDSCFGDCLCRGLQPYTDISHEDKKLEKYSIKYRIEGLFAMDDFVNDFDNEGDLRGYYIPVVADKRTKADKDDRIEAMAAFWERRNCFFNEDERNNYDQIELRDQMLAFEKGSGVAKDGPDALEGAFAECNRTAREDKFDPYITSIEDFTKNSKNRF